MIKKCPVCQSRRLSKLTSAIKCKKCGYINDKKYIQKRLDEVKLYGNI